MHRAFRFLSIFLIVLPMVCPGAPATKSPIFERGSYCSADRILRVALPSLGASEANSIQKITQGKSVAEIKDPVVSRETLTWLTSTNTDPIADDKFINAAQAWKNKDADSLEATVSDLTNHPLAAYPTLWSLLLEARTFISSFDANVHSHSAEPLPWEYLGRLARFVIAHEDEYVAEMARTEWAKLAAHVDDAPMFEMLYEQLIWNKNEPDLRCAHAHFLLKSNNSEENLRLAYSTLAESAYPEMDFCRRLEQTTLKAAPPTWHWQHILMLMQKKRFTHVKELINSGVGKKLPVLTADLMTVLRTPRQWLEDNRSNISVLSGELLTFASLRLATVDLELAAEVAQTTKDKIDATTRVMLWGRLGYIAAVDQKPQALSYYKNAGQALPSAHRNFLQVWQGEQLQQWYARAALRDGTPQELLSAIDGLSEKLKKSHAWIYWRAKTLLDLGQRDPAENLLLSISHGFDFYSLLACDALAVPYYKGAEVLTPALDKETVRQFDENPSIARALTFYRLEMYREGHREWNWALKTMNARKRLELSQYSGLKNVTHRQISTSLSTGRPIFTQIYPRVHCKEIKDVALMSGLPESWIFGVIHQESRFMHSVQSSAGAIGLMQIMPATARWIAKKLSLPEYADEKLFNMDTNLLIGSIYLKRLAEAVDDNIALLTASYNAGPAKAQFWQTTLKRTVDGAVFAETIPYGETRDYVMRVAANIVQYSRYDERPLRLTDILGTVSPKTTVDSALP